MSLDLKGCFWTLRDGLGHVLEVFWDVVGCFGTFWDVFGRFGTFWVNLEHFVISWYVLGVFRGCFETILDIFGHIGMRWGCFGTFWDVFF